MTSVPSEDWYGANQRYLMAVLARVRSALERHAALADEEAAPPPLAEGPETPLQMSPPPALETLSSALGLSPFERELLVMCAGMELEGSFASLCARAQGDPARAYPTFGLALAALPDPEWAAISPGGRLRHWLLVEVGPGNAITSSPLRIDETVLLYLTGVRSPDERLAGLSEPLAPAGDLASSHREIAGEIASAWSKTAGTEAFPVVQLCGRELAGKHGIAAAVGERLGLRLERAPAASLPGAPAEVSKLCRLWNRQAALGASALLLDCDELESAGSNVAVRTLLDGYRGPLLLTTRKRLPPIERPVLTLDVDRPRRDEQRDYWTDLLGDAATELDGNLDTLVAQFDLSLPTIRASLAGALGRVEEARVEGRPGALAPSLWHSCRTQARPRLDDLAERIRRAASWEQLVLPKAKKGVLRQLASHVRHRAKVNEDWGFGDGSSRGLGISALFAGPSGTGKTMAAEVLARELDLDLYRIDLASIVSKYIGETEKNLARVFDAAEEGGAILLFDEADALFGKRSQIKDSHDRYANVEVSYLLQRMESYRGLAILTTNMREALDEAFLRRLRFIIDFPFPDVDDRARIWRRIFPERTPLADLDYSKLARLSLAGGSIRNIALNAAFLAAEGDEAVDMGHLKRAALGEYEKAEKGVPQAQIKDWT